MTDKLRRCVSVVLSMLVMLSLFAGCARSPGPEPLTVTLLKVGKADAIAVLSGEHALLIDAGEEDDGPEVVEFLRRHSVREVEAMIITHYDQDHVGGADTVLEEFPVGTVYVPDYEGHDWEYLDFLHAAKQRETPIQRLDEAVSIPFGDANILIEPPASYEIPDVNTDYDNNFSLITTITHGDNRLVFTGDAEKQRLREWLEGDSAIPCDFLKVPHHGIYNGALEELLAALDPDFSVICSSKKNPAESKTLELLKTCCPNVFETKDGDVLVISDGKRLEVRQDQKS